MQSVTTHDSVSGRAARFVIRDVLLDVVRFPVWWYTRGTANTGRFIWGEILSIADRLSIPILLRNLGKPMYGDYSRSGRIISFFMRLLVFAFKLVGLALWTVALFIAFLLWLLVLPASVMQLWLQIRG